jgi:hypothetical protein
MSTYAPLLSSPGHGRRVMGHDGDQARDGFYPHRRTPEHSCPDCERTIAQGDGKDNVGATRSERDKSTKSLPAKRPRD